MNPWCTRRELVPSKAPPAYDGTLNQINMGSMIVTSNRNIASWGGIFSDPVMAAAIMDRFLFRPPCLPSTQARTGCGLTGSVCRCSERAWAVSLRAQWTDRHDRRPDRKPPSAPELDHHPVDERGS